jgi:hypothetical protein
MSLPTGVGTPAFALTGLGSDEIARLYVGFYLGPYEQRVRQSRLSSPPLSRTRFSRHQLVARSSATPATMVTSSQRRPCIMSAPLSVQKSNCY